MAHAYLFTGTRGTGKTSSAKIFARAINCLHPVEGSPCGECEVCRALRGEDNLDIIELDAASNNGVEEIRDLTAKVQYPPTVGKYKVYIIDEVHMLTTEAFNALLKTLEEPPEQVLFILATTEPHKIPLTVLSRCQRFDFKPISEDAIAGHLLHIAAEEGIPLQPAAAALIARKAEGGMRDAVSLLDQAAATAQGDIGPGEIAELTGSVDRYFILALVKALVQRDVPGMLHLTQQLADSGRDFRAAFADLLTELRDLLALLLEKRPDSDLPEWALALPPARLIHLLVSLADVDSRLRFSREQRITLELAFLKAMEVGEKNTQADPPRIIVRPRGAAAVASASAPSVSKSTVKAATSPLPPWLEEPEPQQDGSPPGEDIPPWDTLSAPEKKQGLAASPQQQEEDNPPWPAAASPQQQEEDNPPWPAAASPQQQEEDNPPWPAAASPQQQEEDNPPRPTVVSPQQQEVPAQQGAVRMTRQEGELSRLQAVWPDVLQQIYKANLGSYFFVTEGRPWALNGDQLTLAFPPGYELHMASACSRPAHKSLIEEKLSQVWGKKLQISGIIVPVEQTGAEKPETEPPQAEEIEEDRLF